MNNDTPRQQLLGFIKFLRAEGFTLGIKETLHCLEITAEAGWPHAAQAKHTLRALTCQRTEDWQRFEELFEWYFYPERRPPEFSAAAHVDPRLRRRGVVGLASSTDDDDVSSSLWGSGAGRQMTITRADYRFLNDRKAMQEAERMAERLALILRVRPTRRRKAKHSGSRLDLRRTWRKNLSNGGVPFRRVFLEPETQPTSLVILHDISHSMSWHNPLLYRFVRGLVRTFRACEAFAFHTKLFRVTDLYREPSVSALKAKLDAQETLWMGGTCIAESIQTFLRQWRSSLTNPNTLVLIISDGFDTDDPEYLVHALVSLRLTYRKVIWLNPMLGRDDYRPDGDSMSAALPYLDALAPAHSLEALSEAISLVQSAMKSASLMPPRMPHACDVIRDGSSTGSTLPTGHVD